MRQGVQDRVRNGILGVLTYGELQQGDVDCKRICSSLGIAGKAGGFDVPTYEDDGGDVAGVV